MEEVYYEFTSLRWRCVMTLKWSGISVDTEFFQRHNLHEKYLLLKDYEYFKIVYNSGDSKDTMLGGAGAIITGGYMCIPALDRRLLG